MKPGAYPALNWDADPIGLRMRRNLMSIAGLSAAIAVATCCAAAAVPASGKPPAPTPQAPNAAVAATNQQVDDIANLQTAVGAVPDIYGGVTGDGPTVVTVCGPETSTNDAVNSAVANLKSDGASVSFHACPYSLRVLQSTLKDVDGSDVFKDNSVTLNRLGLDYEHDVVDIGVSSIPDGFAEIMSAAFGKDIFLSVQAPLVAMSRLADSSPFWGGARLAVPGGYCSSGFAAQATAGGERYMITAGHCAMVSNYIYNGDGTHIVGTVDHRTVGSHTADSELIGGLNYANQIWTGAISSSNYLSVTGRQVECFGCTVQADGSFTGQSAGILKDSTSFCSNVIDKDLGTYYTCGLREMTRSSGTLCQPGDSGGPVYVPGGTGGSAIAVGIITSGSGPGDCFYTEIQPILSQWALEVSTN